MSRQPITKLQASGHRFLTRRLEIALLGGDVDAPHDPVRAQSMALTVGALLSTVVIALALVLAFLRPAPALGDAPIALDRESGALYVRVGDVLHPVLNLASARLIAGRDASPVAVSAAALASVPRGATLGIPGAPAVVAPPLTAAEAAWTVCDSSPRPGAAPELTTVLVGDTQPAEPAVRPSILLVSDPSGAVHLVYDGQRAVVDVDNPTVVQALKLNGVVPRPVSVAFVNLIPEVPAIVVPELPPGEASLTGFPSGTVVQTSSTTGEQYFVVLPGGVQRVSHVVADLLRYADSGQGHHPVIVAPHVITQLPAVESLPVTTYPVADDVPVGADGPEVVCARWVPTGEVVTWLADPPAHPHDLVTLAQADVGGPAVDAVYLPTGRSAFVTAGSGGASCLITDTGVRFGIADDATAAQLGLTAPAVNAPAAVFDLLPHGPELSRTNALIARDTVASGRGVPVAQN